MAHAAEIASQVEAAEAASGQADQGLQKVGDDLWTTEQLRTLYEVVNNTELLAQEWHHHGMQAPELADRIVGLKQQATDIAAKLGQG